MLPVYYLLPQVFLVDYIPSDNGCHYSPFELIAVERGILALGDEVSTVHNPFLVEVKNRDISLAARSDCARFPASGSDNSGWSES